RRYRVPRPLFARRAGAHGRHAAGVASDADPVPHRAALLHPRPDVRGHQGIGGEMGRFEGKGVIVTGAGRGIGQATARRFASEGADVMLIGRTPLPLEETAELIHGEGGKAWAHPCDVCDGAEVRGAVAAALAQWGGRIDVLVNNAGIDDETPFLEMTEQSWRAVVDTNLTGPFLMSRAVAPEMVRAGAGVILHNASIDASGGDGPVASYNASTAGL